MTQKTENKKNSWQMPTAFELCDYENQKKRLVFIFVEDTEHFIHLF